MNKERLMNLIITINNAQMRTINKVKFKGAQVIERKIWRSEMKREKRISCVVTAEIQLTSSMKSQILNKEKSFLDSNHRRASERFLIGFDT